MKPTVESPNGNYCSPLFEQRTSRYRAQGLAKSNKHRQSGYPLMHIGEDEQTGDGFSNYEYRIGNLRFKIAHLKLVLILQI